VNDSSKSPLKAGKKQYQNMAPNANYSSPLLMEKKFLVFERRELFDSAQKSFLGKNSKTFFIQNFFQFYKNILLFFFFPNFFPKPYFSRPEELPEFVE
jgi:hypothetical protein